MFPFLCPSVPSVVITCLDNRRAAQRGRTLVEQRSLTFPTKVPSDSLGWIGSLKRTGDKSVFPMALGSCGHRITHQLRPINMNGRSILAVTSSLREKHGETGWSPDKFQRPAVDGGDQTIADRNGRLRRTYVEFSLCSLWLEIDAKV